MLDSFNTYATKAREILAGPPPTDDTARSTYALAAAVMAYASATKGQPTNVPAAAKLETLLAMALQTHHIDDIDVDECGFPAAMYGPAR